MKKVQLLFVIHCHQPVGSYDSTIQESYKRCYLPLLDALLTHPKVRIALHLTGPLIEWMEKSQPETLGKIRTMVRRRQIEALGGGFYEPILSSLPQPDMLGQIDLTARVTERLFGNHPSGLWIPEQVWDPSFPEMLATTRIKYTFLGDHAFFGAGLGQNRFSGYYVTESAGKSLAVFPIDSTLKGQIPFSSVDDFLAGMKTLASEEPSGITFADEGEKFGLWPGTHSFVHENGWLKGFFNALEENHEWLEMVHPGEYIARFPPSGRIYLPMTCHEEMEQGALSADDGHRLKEIHALLSREGLLEQAKPFLRGGIWNNFLVKYPEANHMHKRMLHLSERLGKAKSSVSRRNGQFEEATQALFRAQCNTPYWHGRLGGIYLRHLRNALYKNLNLADSLVSQHIRGKGEWLTCDKVDLHRDMSTVYIFSCRPFSALIKPDLGGALIELSDMTSLLNLTSVLSRKKEAYHTALANSGEACQVELDKRKDSQVDPAPARPFARAHDWHERNCFVDHFLGPEVTMGSFEACLYRDEGNFTIERYEVLDCQRRDGKRKEYKLHLGRTGQLWRQGRAYPLRIEKVFTLRPSRPGVSCRYTLQNLHPEPLPVRFAMEMNFSFLNPGDPEHRYEIPGERLEDPCASSRGQIPVTRRLLLADRRRPLILTLESDWDAGIWRFPIETLSQSETGLEITHQGTCVALLWTGTLLSRTIVPLSVTLGIESE